MNILRSYRRDMTKAEMKKDGMVHFCKHSYVTNYNKAGKACGIFRVPSEFSQSWKDYKGEK